MAFFDGSIWHSTKRVKNALLGKDPPAGRQVKVRSDDVFLTSYPKSGNTWARFLIANLLWRAGDTDFANIGARVPDVYEKSDKELALLNSPRILKSHEYFHPHYPKVVYIVRDVRSVLVSYYHHHVRKGWIAPDADQAQFAQRFLNGELDSYGTWSDNVISWLRLRGDRSKEFLLVRYEDLRTENVVELRRITNFLGLERTKQELEFSYHQSSLERMQVIEERTSVSWKEDRNRRGSRIVREGRIDGWKGNFDQNSIKKVEDRYRALLRELRYL